jgi:putative flippase GtrA
MKLTSALRAVMQPEMISDSNSGLVAYARAIAVRFHLPRTLVKFLLVGGAAFMIYQVALFVLYDTPVLWFLPEKGTEFDLGPIAIPNTRLLISSIIAIEIAVLFQFNSHERWTFRHRPREGWIGARFLKFNLSSIVSPTIIVVTTNALTAILGWPPYLSAAVGVLLGFAWNWTVGTRIIWPHARASMLPGAAPGAPEP